MPWETARKDPAYNTAAWKRARLNCLRTANWRCEIRTPGTCIMAATQVDHIDGLDNDRQHRHLRAACGPCHKQVTHEQAADARQRTVKDPAPAPRTAW